MDFFQKNMPSFRRRFPGLAQKAAELDISTIAVGKATDNGFFYATKGQGDKWIPLTDPIAPSQNAQKSLDKMQHRLIRGLAPAVIIGLSPGYILDTVYQHFNSRIKYNEPFRHIYVIIDSIPCLVAWLKNTDHTEIIENPNVLFFGADEVHKIVELCENNEQRSHLFIPLNEIDNNTAEKLISPLAELYIRREKEYKEWKKETDAYYEALTDTALLETISGKTERKPRLLIPTHTSSTVVQYSTRDTCAAFERLGWETRILQMERDLSPWRLIKEIKEFKPDILIFINHLRTECEDQDIYPENLLFITWIQDAVPQINRSDSAEKWNAAAAKRKRDLLIGYTEQLRQYGYLDSRLSECSMIVNTTFFKPLEPGEEERHGRCDICFASNRAKTTERIIKEYFEPLLIPLGFSYECLQEMHHKLWIFYRQGQVINSNKELESFLVSNVSCFADAYGKLDRNEKDNVTSRIFWELNDPIYRHIVLEWLDDIIQKDCPGLKLHLYGKGWEEHPRFGKYAKGPVKHGRELSAAYRTAKYSLHLNPLEGSHQRLLEILASGATPLTRCRERNKLIPGELASAFRNIIDSIYGESKLALTDEETASLNDKIFEISDTVIRQNPGSSRDILENKIYKILFSRIYSSFDWIIENWPQLNFQNKDELKRLLSAEDKHISRNTISLLSKISCSQIPITITAKIQELLSCKKNLQEYPESKQFIYPYCRDILEFCLALNSKAALPEMRRLLGKITNPGFEISVCFLTLLLHENSEDNLPEMIRILMGFDPEQLPDRQQTVYIKNTFFIMALTDKIELKKDILRLIDHPCFRQHSPVYAKLLLRSGFIPEFHMQMQQLKPESLMQQIEYKELEFYDNMINADYQRAARNLQEEKDLLKTIPDARTGQDKRSIAEFSEAWLLLKENKLEEASGIMNAVLSSNLLPRHSYSFAFTVQAIIYRNLGMQNAAIEAHENAIKHNGTDLHFLEYARSCVLYGQIEKSLQLTAKSSTGSGKYGLCKVYSSLLEKDMNLKNAMEYLSYFSNIYFQYDHRFYSNMIRLWAFLALIKCEKAATVWETGGKLGELLKTTDGKREKIFLFISPGQNVDCADFQLFSKEWELI